VWTHGLDEDEDEDEDEVMMRVRIRWERTNDLE